MEKWELEEIIDTNTVSLENFRAIMAAVEAYSSASNRAKPIVSGSLPDDSELEDWLFDGYERNDKNLERLKIGRVVRDRIARKLNSGNDH